MNHLNDYITRILILAEIIGEEAALHEFAGYVGGDVTREVIKYLVRIHDIKDIYESALREEGIEP